MSESFPGLAPAALDALAGGQRIVITGASGWLGQATIELLHRALGSRLHERLRCFGSSARTLTLRGGLQVKQRPLGEIADLEPQATWVLHFAFLTKDKVAGMDADAYASANAALSRKVLDALDRIGANAVFVASSGAARFADDPDAAHDMRLYGALKRRDEDDFAAWAERAGQTAVIARIFNLAGPYINKHQAYALAAFIKDAIADRPIIVRAPHQVVRGFIAIRELMSLTLLLMLNGRAGAVRFDTGGQALELADVARAVDRVLGGRGIERAAITSDRVDRYVGDAARYDALRAEHGIESVSLDVQICETAQSMIAVPITMG